MTTETKLGNPDTLLTETPILNLFDPLVHSSNQAEDVFSAERIVNVVLLGYGVLRTYLAPLSDDAIAESRRLSLLSPLSRKLEKVLSVVIESSKLLDGFEGDSRRERDWINRSILSLRPAEDKTEDTIDFTDEGVYIAASFSRMIAYKLQEFVIEEAGAILGDNAESLFNQAGVEIDDHDRHEMGKRFDGMSHDLRSPLTPIKGYSDFFEKVTSNSKKSKREKARQIGAVMLDVKESAEALMTQLGVAYSIGVEGRFEKERILSADFLDIIAGILKKDFIDVNHFPEGLQLYIDESVLACGVEFSTDMAKRVAHNWGLNILNKLEDYQVSLNGRASAWLSLSLKRNNGRNGLEIGLSDNLGGIDDRIKKNEGRFIRGLTTSRSGHGDGMTLLAADVEAVYRGEMRLKEINVSTAEELDGVLGATNVKIPDMLLREPNPNKGRGATSTIWLPLA